MRVSVIERNGMVMLEVEPGALHFNGPSGIRQRVEELDQRTLRGEIVDGKCWMGVMNPGEGQVHRDCADRCLRGGLPPMFVAGAETMILLGQNAPAGVPLTLGGKLKRTNGWLVFEVNGQ